MDLQLHPQRPRLHRSLAPIIKPPSLPLQLPQQRLDSRSCVVLWRCPKKVMYKWSKRVRGYTPEKLRMMSSHRDLGLSIPCPVHHLSPPLQCQSLTNRPGKTRLCLMFRDAYLLKGFESHRSSQSLLPYPPRPHHVTVVFAAFYRNWWR